MSGTPTSGRDQNCQDVASRDNADCGAVVTDREMTNPRRGHDGSDIDDRVLRRAPDQVRGEDLTDLPVGDVPSGTESGDELPTRDNHRNDQRDPGISRRRLSTHAWRMS